MNPNHSLLALHLAVVLLGGTALFSKLIPLPALDITGLRGLVAAALLLVSVLLLRSPLRLRQRGHYALALVLGLLFAVHWMTYFQAIRVSSVATGIIAMFAFPVMTALLEPLFGRSRLRPRSLGLAALVTLGIALMVTEAGFQGDVAAGIPWGLLSAFTYALRNTLQRRYLNEYPALTIMLYQSAVTALVLLPFLTTPVGAISTRSWELIVLLAALFTALPHTLVAYSLKHMQATQVGFVMSLQVLYATLFAAVVLSETPGPATLAGGLLVLAAAISVTQETRHPPASVSLQETRT